MRLFGLIGYPLSHSFSKKYFAEKFAREGITDADYALFPIAQITDFPALVSANPTLRGLNVTIPYKQQIIPFLDDLNDAAARIGAVNVIKLHPDGTKTGYNSDYFGFRQSLTDWFRELHGVEGERTLRQTSALILGTGGASKAVKVALDDLGVASQFISREPSATAQSYAHVNRERLATHRLIINTTPLGMYPATETCPPIPYEYLTSAHYLYDLVYNPTETEFLRQGKARSAATLNGIPMLYAQAEKSWEIWNA